MVKGTGRDAPKTRGHGGKPPLLPAQRKLKRSAKIPVAYRRFERARIQFTRRGPLAPFFKQAAGLITAHRIARSEFKAARKCAKGLFSITPRKAQYAGVEPGRGMGRIFFQGTGQSGRGLTGSSLLTERGSQPGPCLGPPGI
jgi:hypothetical protein